jgi:hypothetical protein
MGKVLISHPGVNGGTVDELDTFPPPRQSVLPPLDSREAQSEFLRSPTAVVESLGLRIPAALSQHIRRRSSLPPPPVDSATPSLPAASDEVSGIQRVADVLPPPPKVPVEAAPVAQAPAPPVEAAVETKRARPRSGRRKKS